MVVLPFETHQLPAAILWRYAARRVPPRNYETGTSARCGELPPLLPVRGLCMKELSLLAREWRNSPTTGSTGFASKSCGHAVCSACQLLPTLRPANCESDFAISTSQAIGQLVITAAAAPVGSVEPISGPAHGYGAGAFRLNHPHQDLVRSIGACPASPPTP
jgi:hypothetical protein